MKRLLYVPTLLFVLLFASCGGTEDKNLLKDIKLFPMQLPHPDYKSMQGNYIYLDRKGNQAFEGEFQKAGIFVDGLAKVKTREGWAFINEKGEVVIDAGEYRYVTSFSEGVAWALGDGICAIDKKGKKLFEFEGRIESHFHEGLAAAKASKHDSNVGFINKKGEAVIEPVWGESDYSYFSNGMAIVSDGSGKKGAINTAGKLTVDYLFKGISTFDQNGCAVVQLSNEDGDYDYGLINNKGKFMIKPGKYERIYPDGEWYKVAVRNNEDEEKIGWCDKNGKIKIKPTLKSRGYGEINEGFFYGDKWAYVSVDGVKCFINKSGKVVLTPDYSVVAPFMNDIAIIYSQGTYRLMNRDGKLIGYGMQLYGSGITTSELYYFSRGSLMEPIYSY